MSFFVSPSDPILTESPCEGISAWMQAAPGPKKAARGAELFDRLLDSPGVDRRYAQVRRTVWALTHLSQIVTAHLEAGKPLTSEQIRRLAETIFHVEPAVPILGRAGTGGRADAPRLGVRFHYHFPFYALVVPHDGGDPVMEHYPHGEISPPALTAAERLDTSTRWVRLLRGHLTSVWQQHSDVESIQRACFSEDHGLWIKSARHVLPVWSAFQPFRPAIGNPLVPTVGRSIQAQKFEDLFSVGADFEIVRNLALAFDESRSPDVMGHVRRLFRKRRIDEARRQRSGDPDHMLRILGRDPRQIPSGNMDQYAANELLRKWTMERLQKDGGEPDTPAQPPSAELRPSPSPNGKPGQANHLPELNDLWVDRAGDIDGWAPKATTHRQPGRPVNATWATETDRLHWERCRDEYRATLNPLKQTVLGVLLDDPEITWRDMTAILTKRHFPTTVNERTLRLWMQEIRAKIARLGESE